MIRQVVNASVELVSGFLLARGFGGSGSNTPILAMGEAGGVWWRTFPCLPTTAKLTARPSRRLANCEVVVT